ncbi:hypothetical protein [Streptomyces zhihengii]
MNLKRRNDAVFYGSLATLLAAGLILRVTYGPFTTAWTWVWLGLSAVLWAALLARWDTQRQRRKTRAHAEGPRPINPDGSPYSYHQIRDGGWKHCDGCDLWAATWTSENPHRCTAPLHVMHTTDKEAGR